MTNDFLIISVESQKGGVGKTTAALNLAKILLEDTKKKRAILFIDADITGTNAAECLDSLFWKDICKPVRSSQMKKNEAENLLAIFERQFMPGRSRPKFVMEDSGGNRSAGHWLVLAPEKINVFGSQIYEWKSQFGSKESDSQDVPKDIRISKPSILFDECTRSGS